ncbi:hypothetical protein M514_24257 [Trichuris suis]|uniref:Uncharacterized protein n=1 Tax=Trichuris suis TaxID=68888 RepID=A0A085N248_9BILA|nr:hypothetical protein M514_24257 [Trichuris suis]
MAEVVWLRCFPIAFMRPTGMAMLSESAFTIFGCTRQLLRFKPSESPTPRSSRTHAFIADQIGDSRT